MSVPHVKIARRVTKKHGEIFAENWLEDALDGASIDGLSRSRVMEWPGGENDSPEQLRYLDIAQEILERTLTIAQPAIGEAFMKAAREILARERRINRTASDGD